MYTPTNAGIHLHRFRAVDLRILLVQSGNAAPDHLLPAPAVPMGALKHIAAVPTEHNARSVRSM